MKITAVRPVVVHVNHRGDWVFVHVHTDEGLIGLGEASHSLNDAVLLTVLEQFEKRIVGKDPRQIEEIWTTLYRKDAGRVENSAISGIDQALWDILGQSLGVPIRTLLGGTLREKIRLYANINRHVQDRSPDGFAVAAAEAVAEGFTAVKLAPFDEVRAPDHIRTGPKAAWRRGVERVRAVRQAIGEDIDLMIDCHGRFDTSESIIVANELLDVGLYWYEEPVHHFQYGELERITNTIPTPTASAESVFSVERFAPFLSRPLVDVIMPDVKHDGGISELKKISEAARMRKLLVAPHNPAGPVSTAASAQAVCGIRNFLILEFAWGEVDWRAQLLDPAEKIEDGYLVLPEGPGLGHVLNPDMLDAHGAVEINTVDSTKVVVQE